MSCTYRVAFGTMVAFAMLTTPAIGQVTNGHIHGVVTDASGATTPGVTVTLTSPALLRPMVEVTTVSGRYDFPIVPIGTYSVSFELSGFKRVVRAGVIIETGFQAEVNAQLDIGGVTETVEVSGAPPIIDTRKTSVGATFNREVMDSIPTARDPWQIINMAAGVEANTFNVGGNQSGQQLLFGSRGQGFSDTMWNVEGATITDMASTGSSPTYFDFESLQEIQVTTGGGDASLQTSGLNINLVTRSGSNAFKGSARVAYSDDNLQSQNVTRALFDQGANSGAPLKHYREWGGEAGGPIVQDKAWWWAAAAQQHINGSVLGFFDHNRAGCTPPPPGFENIKDNQKCLKDDLTVINTYNGKVNLQLSSAHQFQFLYTYATKVRNARGATILRAPESVFRQTGTGPGNFNFKYTWIINDRLLFQTLAQHQGAGSNLLEQPGTEGVQPLVNRDTGFVSRGLYTVREEAVQPTTEVKTDGYYFLSNVLGGDHAAKFGVRYRNTPWRSDWRLNGDAEARVSSRFAAGNPRPGSVCPTCALGPDRARVVRPGANPAGLFTIGAYVQDSFTRGRLRLNLGVRWDYQNDKAKAGCVEGNSILPDLLPAVCFDGADPGVNFSDIAPRFSATYDVFGTGKTVVKSGFARYFGQGVGLSNGLTALLPITVTFQNAPGRMCWNDANGDQVVSRDELNLTDPRCVVFPTDFNPETGLQRLTLNEVDPALQNDRTTELTAGIEHELLPNLAVGVNYMYRLYDRFRTNVRIGETKDMWVPREWSDADFIAAGVDPPSQFGLPSTGWTYYEFDPARVRPAAIARMQNVVEDRRYHGVDITVTKRLAGRWMLNAAITLQSRTQTPNFCFDCTNNDKIEGINDITAYIVKLSGMYLLPGGWRASANLQVQQGQNRAIFFDGPPSGYRSNGIGSRLGAVSFTAYDFGTKRDPVQHLLDAQVAKSFELRGGRQSVSLTVSVFNVLNANTVRGTNTDLNSLSFGQVNDILAPRVARIQASIRF